MYGCHVNRYHAKGKRPSIVEHITVARKEALDEAGFLLTTAAIFVGGPKNREITLHPEERKELHAYVKQTGIRVIAHSSYTASPWTGDPDAARYIREELSVCQEAGIAGLVIHLPKLPTETVMKYIPRLLNPAAPNVRIYLETPAIRPADSQYETPEKLANLFTAIRKEVDPKLASFGLCIDSAHLWVCGVDLETYAAADAWINELEHYHEIIPPSAIMLHLNDSMRARGVGPDTHAPLTQGRMWEQYHAKPILSGLGALVDYAERHNLPVILERAPKESLKGDYLVLRKLGVGIAPE